jgi:hypothetical protein
VIKVVYFSPRIASEKDKAILEEHLAHCAGASNPCVDVAHQTITVFLASSSLHEQIFPQFYELGFPIASTKFF